MSQKPTLFKKALVALTLGLSLTLVPRHCANAVVSNQATQTITAFGDGSTVNFTIGFTFQHNSDVYVFLQDRTSSPWTTTQIIQGSGSAKFTISGGDPGTTVVMGTAPTSTQKLIIQRTMAFTQTVNYVETDAFPAEDHEAQMDKNILLLQQINQAVDQKLGLSPTSTFATPTLPDPSSDQFLIYDHAGTGLTLAPATFTTGDTLQYNGSAWVNFGLTGALATLTNGLAAHEADTSNPHHVTAAQVGNTVAQWNANQIKGVLIDDSSKSDGRILQFQASSGHFIYSPVPVAAALTDTHLLIGNASNLGVDLALSGDASLADTGALTVLSVGGSTAANVHAAELLANAATAANTVGALLKRDGSGQVAATTFTGALVGNASTATTLAANPTDCGANTYATAIDASGNLTCSAVPDGALSTSYIKADGSRALTGNWNVGAFNITASTFIGALTGHGSLDCALTGCTMSGGIVGTTLSLSTPLPVSSGGIGAATFSANAVFAGPTSGSAAAPGPRSLVLADMPIRQVVVGTPQTVNGAFSTSSFADFTHQPTVSFTASFSGKYRVYVSAPISSQGGASVIRINNSAGSATVNFSQEGVWQSADGSVNGSVYCYIICTLTSGTSYTFTVQGKNLGSTTANFFNATPTNGIALVAEQIE